LYDRQHLLEIGVPLQLTDVIRPLAP